MRQLWLISGSEARFLSLCKLPQRSTHRVLYTLDACQQFANLPAQDTSTEWHPLKGNEHEPNTCLLPVADGKATLGLPAGVDAWPAMQGVI